MDRLEEHLHVGALFLTGQHDVEFGLVYCIVLAHPDRRRRLKLTGTVVRIDEGAKAGVAMVLANFNDDLRDRIASFGSGSAGTERTLLERAAKLPGSEQRKLARSRLRDERVVAERLLGKVVWEDLLRNPNITQPEVARIAQRHDLPIPRSGGAGGSEESQDTRKAKLARDPTRASPVRVNG